MKAAELFLEGELLHFPSRYRAIVWEVDDEGYKSILDIMEFKSNVPFDEIQIDVNEMYPDEKYITYEKNHRFAGWKWFAGFNPRLHPYRKFGKTKE